MTEHNPHSDDELEQMLSSLPARRPPAELRGRVLSQLQLLDEELGERNRLLWIRPIVVFRWERALNVALLLLVLAAPLSWLANLSFQDRTMTRLMGPTPAERQAQRVVESMHLADSGKESLSLQNELASAIEVRAQDRGEIICIHSLGYAGYLIAEHSK